MTAPVLRPGESWPEWTPSSLAYAIGGLLVIVPGVLSIAFFVGLVIALWGGWCLHVVWGWHLVPLGLPALTWAQATAACLIAGFMTRRFPQDSDRVEPPKEWKRRSWWLDLGLYGVVHPAMFLAFGWALRFVR